MKKRFIIILAVISLAFFVISYLLPQRIGGTDYTGVYTDAGLYGTQENVEVKKGEDLFIESKIGDKAYITQQIDHMKKQVEGHHNEGNESKNGYKSIIVVSADYKNINDEKRAEFEKHLKEVGTEVVVLDKMVSEIDDKVRESI